MDDDHLSKCPFCGKAHDSSAMSRRLAALVATVVPSVGGSRMRHGGIFRHESGMTLGTDEWRNLRCRFCGGEAMTPIELIPPMSMQDTDGAYLGHCGQCQHDIESGFKPGHNPNRRRRRR